LALSANFLMKPLRTLALFLCLCGQVRADDTVSSFIKSLPWDTSNVVQLGKDKKADIEITIAYDKPGVISDADTYRLQLRPRKKDALYSRIRKIANRDSFGPTGKWCNGGAYVGKVTKDALEIGLSLSWGEHREKKGSFQKTILLPWKETQTIEQDGFKIVVSVKRIGA
jgi:hypothetical protein